MTAADDVGSHGERSARLVVLAGVAAALHVGKLPPALPALRDGLGLTLIEAGFMLSLVQFAGMAFGLAVGLLADRFGLRRGMLLGLAVLGTASLAGGYARTPAWLLAARACEGAGFLLAVTPAPSLIRRLVGPQADRVLGLWGAYMPFGTALALLAAPLVLGRAGWSGWWWLLGALTLAMAGVLRLAVPADPGQRGVGGSSASNTSAAPTAIRFAPVEGLLATAGRTLSSPAPWALALAFGAYSGQWLAVLGFLPSVYAQAGIAATPAAALTALVAAGNMIGNIAAGRLLQRGWPARRLLRIGYAAMALGAAVAYLPVFAGLPALRFAGAFAFSAFGGLVPGTLFALAVRLAPGPRTVSSTVGWMQQCSACGQFAGPPLVAWVAHRVGGWEWTWVVTAAMAGGGWWASAWLARLLARPVSTA